MASDTENDLLNDWLELGLRRDECIEWEVKEVEDFEEFWILALYFGREN